MLSWLDMFHLQFVGQVVGAYTCGEESCLRQGRQWHSSCIKYIGMPLLNWTFMKCEGVLGISLLVEVCSPRHVLVTVFLTFNH